jgi:hypothetical protein
MESDNANVQLTFENAVSAFQQVEGGKIKSELGYKHCWKSTTVAR